MFIFCHYFPFITPFHISILPAMCFHFILNVSLNFSLFEFVISLRFLYKYVAGEGMLCGVDFYKNVIIIFMELVEC